MSAECTPRTARRGEELTSRASMLDVDEPEVIYVKRAKDSSKPSSKAGPGASAAQTSMSVCDVDEHEAQRRGGGGGGGGGGGSPFYSQGETADDHRQREGIDVILGPDQIYSRMPAAPPAVLPGNRQRQKHVDVILGPDQIYSRLPAAPPAVQPTAMSMSSRSPDVASHRGRSVAPLMHSQAGSGQPYNFHFNSKDTSEVNGTSNERERQREGISGVAPTITQVARFVDTSFGSFGAPQTAYAGVQPAPASPPAMPQQEGAQVMGGAHSVRYYGSSDKHLPTSKRGAQLGSGSYGAPSHVVAAEPKKKEEDKKAALFDLIGMMGWFEENLDPTIEREPGVDRGESERERQVRVAQEKEEKRMMERMYVATRLKAEEERRSRLAMYEATRVIQPAAASLPRASSRDAASSDRGAGSNADLPSGGEPAPLPGEGFRVVGGVGHGTAHYAAAAPVHANGAQAVVQGENAAKAVPVVYGEPLSAASSASVVMGVPIGGETGTGFHYIAEGGTVAVGEWVPPPAAADPSAGVDDPPLDVADPSSVVEASDDVGRESSSAPAETPSTSQKSQEWI